MRYLATENDFKTRIVTVFPPNKEKFFLVTVGGIFNNEVAAKNYSDTISADVRTFEDMSSWNGDTLIYAERM